MGFRRGRTKQQVTLWHEGFHDVITERAPPGFEVIGEFLLSRRPRRADLLLLRREDRERRDHEARILRGLWPRLAAVTIVEFKSPSRGFRPSDLICLGSYGAQYHATYLDRIGGPAGLTLVLVTPAMTQALAQEIALMGWRMDALGNGYAALAGAWYTTYVVLTDEVAEAEHDDFLRIFSQRDVQTREAHHWLEHWLLERRPARDPTLREGYEEMVQKLLSSLTPEQRLAGLDPEQRLAGLDPEQRLAGLKPEEQILALSDEVLRGFSEEYIRSLPRRVQNAIRKRLAKSGS